MRRQKLSTPISLEWEIQDMNWLNLYGRLQELESSWAHKKRTKETQVGARAPLPSWTISVRATDRNEIRLPVNEITRMLDAFNQVSKHCFQPLYRHQTRITECISKRATLKRRVNFIDVDLVKFSDPCLGGMTAHGIIRLRNLASSICRPKRGSSNKHLLVGEIKMISMRLNYTNSSAAEGHLRFRCAERYRCWWIALLHVSASDQQLWPRPSQ